MPLTVCLWVAMDPADPTTFQVFSSVYDKEEQFAREAVLKLDYNYTPWPREGGNLLWS